MALMDDDLPSGKILVTTRYAEYLIDTGRKQLQRALLRDGERQISGDWKPITGFHLESRDGNLHLHVDAESWSLDSGIVLNVEEVQ